MKKRWKLASFLSALAIAAGGVAIAAPANAATLCASQGNNVSWGPGPATGGSTMYPGSVCLTNGPYTAVFQNDNNFVVYKNSTPLWSSQTNTLTSTRYIYFQWDGNIVMYNTVVPVGPQDAVWWANKGNYSDAVYSLQMQSDGNLVEYGYTTTDPNSARSILWATYTNGK